MRVRVVAIAAGKGGVGKTSVSLGIAAGLAELGVRVVLVDLDPAAGASTALGIEPPAHGPTLADVLAGRARLTDVLVELAHVPGLALAPADLRLREVENRPPSPLALRAALEAANVELAVVDTPPGWGPLALLALAGASELVVVTAPGVLPAHALADLLDALDDVRRRFPPGPRLLGVVLNRATRTRLTAETEAALARSFGRKLLPTLSERSAVAAAASEGLPVALAAPSSPAARESGALVAELARRLRIEPANPRKVKTV